MEQLQAFEGGTCGTSDLTDVLGAAVSPAPTFPAVLDACCGGRAMWFDKRDKRGMFVDVRNETIVREDMVRKDGTPWRGWTIDVTPDKVADFTKLPFHDNTFALVVFDPPHLSFGEKSYMTKQYGTLRGKDWRAMLRDGFAECFRVLRPEGVLIFKWCEVEILLSEILALTPERPLFGHKSGKQQKTHWVTFMKAPNVQDHRPCAPLAQGPRGSQS